MPRHHFGGGDADWIFQIDGTTGDALPITSTPVIFFDSLVGGLAITDLLDSTGTPAVSVTTDASGFLPEFQGPSTTPDTRRLAVDANSGLGPRYWVFATDLSGEIDTIEASVTALLGGAGGGGSSGLPGQEVTPWRMGDAVQRIGGPFYIYPTYFVAGGGAWAELQKAAPYISLVFVNVASGPGTSPNADFTAQLAQMRAAGITVLGYVPTGFGGGDVPTIQGMIDNWYSFYNVDGILFDTVSADPVNQPFYLNLYNYVKAKTTGLRMVVINPGEVPDESYMNCCDIVSDFEGDIGLYRAFANPSWQINYPSNRFLHVVFGCYSEKQRDEALYLTRINRAGYVFVTDDTLGNPYDTVPGASGGGKTAPVGNAYWENMIAQISEIWPVTPWAPKVEDGFENFDGGPFSTLWTVPGGSTAVIAGAQLQLTCSTSGNDELKSSFTYNFTGLRAEIEATTVPSITSGLTLMRVITDPNNYVAIGKSGTNLIMRSRVGGVNSDTTLAYDATNHKWWKIDLVSGTVTWWTSPDGNTWTSRRTLGSGLPALTAVAYSLFTVRTADSNQTVNFDNALSVGASA
jgi:hypothetical protein